MIMTAAVYAYARVPCEGKLVAGRPYYHAPALDGGGGGVGLVVTSNRYLFADSIVIVGSAPLWRSPMRGWLTREIALAYFTRSRGRFTTTGAAKPARSLLRRPCSRYNNNNNIILPRSGAL